MALTKEKPMLSFSDGVLVCPLCGGTYTHLNDVHVDGRPREDGAHIGVHVDHHGRVDTDSAIPEQFRGDRRHAITLVGSCEHCSGRFAVVWRQHKGRTEVSVLRSDWTPAEPT